jgi:hypothetical protein
VREEIRFEGYRASSRRDLGAQKRGGEKDREEMMFKP